MRRCRALLPLLVLLFAAIVPAVGFAKPTSRMKPKYPTIITAVRIPPIRHRRRTSRFSSSLMAVSMRCNLLFAAVLLARLIEWPV